MSKGVHGNIKLRRASAQEWSAVNPILVVGEPGVELDTFKMKIGNGVLAWNELPYLSCEAKITPTEYQAILVVETLPEVGEEKFFYKLSSDQKIYYWNNVSNSYVSLNFEFNPDDFVDTNTDNILIVEVLPEVGQENLLYKTPDQLFHFWNIMTQQFEVLNFVPAEDDDEDDDIVVKGGIEVVETVSALPETGAPDILYKVLENEQVYTWNASSNSYSAIGAATEGKTSLVVVENFSALPEVGENDILYKTNATQLLYMWNGLTNMYDQLGQGGGGPVAPEGYAITLQNALDSRIFAALDGDPVELAFRYSSIDKDGLNDGPGIGALIVNDVKKATIAVA
jgi:hypothetical protein